MEDKISIILPIYNVANHLRGGIDSLLNQTIGTENLEIIMVDDGSTDGSGDIIDEYANNHECCIAIHFEENSGSPTAPRNRGIEESTGDFIMFLDPDDRFVEDCCETLYNTIIEYDVDIVLARFRRIFPGNQNVQKSYSPFIDELELRYPDEKFRDANPLGISDTLWNGVFKNIVYGRNNKSNYDRDKPIDKLVINNIQEEIDILDMSPAIWSKIYRRSLIMDNNIRYKNYRCSEDLVFSLETFLKAQGIVLLNNYICYNYIVRDFDEEYKSITHDVDLRFLKETLNAYRDYRIITEDYPKEIQVTVNPYLMFWMNAWRSASLTKENNIELLKKGRYVKKIHKSALKPRLLLSAMSTMLESSIYTR